MAGIVERFIMQPSLVRPIFFYSEDAEKTKFNWFCYEYASEIVLHIDSDFQKRLHRKGVDDLRIVDFAVYFARHMKAVVRQKLESEFNGVPMSYRDIEKFFPRLANAVVDDLLTVVAKAWDSLLEVCSVCPARCVSEREQLTEAFDDPNL